MCNYCSKIKPKNWSDNIKGKKFTNDSLTDSLDTIIEGNVLTLNYNAYSCDSSFSEEIKIKFCPMCGRSL